MTGRYQTRFGHEFNPHVGDEDKLGLPLDQKTIADYFHAAGYATGLVGKWHQGYDRGHHPQSRGFDDFFGFLMGSSAVRPVAKATQRCCKGQRPHAGLLRVQTVAPRSIRPCV